MAKAPEFLLLGDVGGTNCRLALETVAAPIAVAHRVVYSTDDFPSPRDAIAAFLAKSGDAKPKRAAIAIAAPVIGEEVKLTNSSWRFDRNALKKAFGLDQLLLVNDLAAQARAVQGLDNDAYLTIGVGASAPFTRTMSIVGPGTGLGVTSIDPSRGEPVITTEGGHVGFAPGDDVELELLRLWRQHLGAVSNEHVVSGPGMVRIYRALAALNDVHAEPIDGPEIVRRALANEDPHCRETAERFVKILGSVAGDIVLAQGAAGVILVGGIVNSLAPIVQQGGFRARFEQRGPGHAFLTNAPSMIATTGDLGFQGVSALLRAGSA